MRKHKALKQAGILPLTTHFIGKEFPSKRGCLSTKNYFLCHPTLWQEVLENKVHFSRFNIKNYSGRTKCLNIIHTCDFRKTNIRIFSFIKIIDLT